MFTELHYECEDIEDQIYPALLELGEIEEVIVIRKGFNEERDRSYWVNFLSEKCNFILDQRHYDFQADLQKNEWWEISNQPDKENAYAYSTTPQPLHTDNAWFQDSAEINFFIMEKQVAKGGEQLIYPLSRLVNDLEKKDSSLLNDLLKTKVVISKGDDKNQNITPIITLEDGGKIHWNYYRTLKTDDFINELCERFFSFLSNQEKTNSVDMLRCETGDCFAFNDKKLLHGRTSFETTGPRQRILIQSMWKI